MVVALNRSFLDPEEDERDRVDQAAGLRALAERVAPTSLARERTLPILPALAGLLGPSGPAERGALGPSGFAERGALGPSGLAGLRRGTTATVAGGTGLGATSLALALVAAATQAGSWAAVVGLPAAHAPAAAYLGVALERLAFVPDAATLGHWPTVVAALLDGVDLVVAAVPPGLRAPDARRLAARARERGSVLVPLLPAGASWVEGADLRLRVVAATWHGVEAGHGFLQAREVEVAATGRGAAGRERSVHLWLPGYDGVAVAERAAEDRRSCPGTRCCQDDSSCPGRAVPQLPGQKVLSGGRFLPGQDGAAAARADGGARATVSARAEHDDDCGGAFAGSAATPVVDAARALAVLVGRRRRAVSG